MPGFMGLRGLELKSQIEIEGYRHDRHHEDHRRQELERRSREKVQEILQNQVGDMSAYNPVQRGDVLVTDSAVAHLAVSDIMSSRVAVLTYDDTMLTVQGIFSSVRFHHLPVVDEDGYIIGIVSDRDFLRLASPFLGTVNEQPRDKEVMTRKVGTVMTRNPVCIDVDTEVIEAIRTMTRKRISCLPVLEASSRRLQGIVTWKDIVRAFCPAAFDAPSDSARLKQGVAINPESSETQRLRAKAAESVRLRAAALEAQKGMKKDAPKPDAAPSEKSTAGAPPPVSDRVRKPGAAGKPKPGGDTDVFQKPLPLFDDEDDKK